MLLRAEGAPCPVQPSDVCSRYCSEPLTEPRGKFGRLASRASDVPRVHDQLGASHLDESFGAQQCERCLHEGSEIKQGVEASADLKNRGIEQAGGEPARIVGTLAALPELSQAGTFHADKIGRCQGSS